MLVVSVSALLLAACGSETTAPAGGSSGANPSGGCGGARGAVGYAAKQSIQAAGKARTYGLFVPEGYDGSRALPLVFVFHGSGGSGDSIRKSYPLEGVANGGGIFVYPDGNGGEWNLDAKADKNPDIALFDALTGELSTRYCVDKRRIFATGYSNGGYFANQLGCRRGNTLRAIASHAGGGPFGDNDEYDERGDLVCPESPVAALLAHGAGDSSVGIDEGEKSLAHWRRANGCQEGSRPYDPSPCVAYDGCNASRPVVWCKVPGLGHVVWPENGSKVTWAFFTSL